MLAAVSKGSRPGSMPSYIVKTPKAGGAASSNSAHAPDAEWVSEYNCELICYRNSDDAKASILRRQQRKRLWRCRAAASGIEGITGESGSRSRVVVLEPTSLRMLPSLRGVGVVHGRAAGTSTPSLERLSLARQSNLMNSVLCRHDRGRHPTTLRVWCENTASVAKLLLTIDALLRGRNCGAQSDYRVDRASLSESTGRECTAKWHSSGTRVKKSSSIFLEKVVTSGVTLRRR
jgi:hypothetical protein